MTAFEAIDADANGFLTESEVQMAIHAIRLSSSHSESAAAMVDLIGGTASLVRARGHDTITGVTVSKVGHRCSSLRTPATRRLGALSVARRRGGRRVREQQSDVDCGPLTAAVQPILRLACMRIAA